MDDIDAFINSFPDEPMDEPVTAPPIVTAAEEAGFDRIIRREIIPIVERYRLNHQGNMPIATDIDWQKFFRLPFFALSEDVLAAVYLKVGGATNAVAKKIIVKTWDALQEARNMRDWRTLSYAALEAVVRQGAGETDFTYRWFCGDYAAVCSEKNRAAVDVVISIAAKYRETHPITEMPVSHHDLDALDLIIKSNACKGENLKLSLARVADAAKRMGFPALTAISAAITYDRCKELKKELKYGCY